jgi:hypothetical protein
MAENSSTMSAMMLEYATIYHEQNREFIQMQGNLQLILPGGHQRKRSLYIAHMMQQNYQAPNLACSIAFQQQDRQNLATISCRVSILSAA